jgi:SOS-response transcriptional repressor LexA
MHPIQEGILELAATRNIAKLSLRELGRMVTGTEQQPQKVKYHRDCLVEDGYLRFDKERDVYERVLRGEKHTGFISLPIVGAANCGPALQIAEQDIEGYLCLSEKFLPQNHNGLFIIRATGSSMNAAKVNGKKTINSGDFVIIDGNARQPKNNDYVLAVAEGNANIKKFRKEVGGRVMLLSESTEDFPPIYIHQEDKTNFFINGKVIDVLKKPSD